MKKCLFLAVAVLSLTLFALTTDVTAQKKRRTIKLPPITVTVPTTDKSPAGLRQEAFDKAWSTINENYFDKAFSGLDWAKIKQEYQPKVTAAKTDYEFHRVLKEMISRLGKSHLNIIVPEYFESLEAAKNQARLREKELAIGRRAANIKTGAGTDEDEETFGDPALRRYGIGVELRLFDGRIVITHIDDRSGAVLAGLKPGYVIDKINGVALSEIINQAFVNGFSVREIRYVLPLGIIEAFLNGPQDSSVQLTCLDQNDKPLEFTVPRLELSGEVISISKNLPEQFLNYESRSISADVGYIKFSAFAVAVIGKFCDSLTEFANKKAIIIDLRGNIGGVIGSMFGLTGMLTEYPLTMGMMQSRTANEPFMVSPKKKHFRGRVVLLVDSESLSASEIFAAGLKNNWRALVVGERTGGASLPSIWVKLATGAVMVYPIADFITADGTSLEGRGLEPDLMIAMDRPSLLRGEDLQLKEAIVLAADEKAFAKQMASRMGSVSGKQGSGLSSGSGDGPAPPPPPAKAKPSKLALPTPETTPTPNDAKALKIISDFAAAVGGIQAVKNISSYDAKGIVKSERYDESEADVYAARQFPDKFVLVLTSPSVGEVREIYNGKNSYLQADNGIDRDLYPYLDTTRFHLLSAFFDVLDPEYLHAIKYEGEFELDGRMRQVLSAVNAKGLPVGMSFDSATKMLASYSSPGSVYTLGDYRKVDGVTLPFQIEMERVSKIKLNSVTINPKLDPSNFEKKEKCFDRAN